MRILEDSGLQPGDIVSTNRGLFRFQGNPDRERKPDDFVRIRWAQSGLPVWKHQRGDARLRRPTSRLHHLATKSREVTMFAELKFVRAAIALLVATFGFASTPASAITAEVAKACNALVAKEFPPREPGNPAAGSTKGTAQSQRSYFSKCVSNDGHMDNANNDNDVVSKKTKP
jgi:hypothetical protein